MKCIVCGATDYPASFGGANICPSCDCGTTYQKNGKVMIEIPLEEYQRLLKLNGIVKGMERE